MLLFRYSIRIFKGNMFSRLISVQFPKSDTQILPLTPLPTNATYEVTAMMP